MYMRSLSIALFVTSNLLTTPSYATDVTTPSLWKYPIAHDVTTVAMVSSVLNDEHKKRKPPKEAVEACEGKSEGDSCEFKGRNDDNVTGTCQKPKKDTGDASLVCRPAHKGGKKREKTDE